MPSLPPTGRSFSLFALSEFFTIHFSSFAWDRFNSGFHPFTASQIANPHSPLVFQWLLKKLPPSSSSWPPPFPPRLARLALVPWLFSPASFLFLLFPPLFVYFSLPLPLPPSAPPPLQGRSFALGRETLAGLAPRQQGAGRGRGRGGAGRGGSAGAAAAGVAGSARGQITRRRQRRRPAGPALSALSRGLRRAECAADDREEPQPSTLRYCDPRCPPGRPSPLLRHLLPSRPLRSPAPSL
jgi:hypothetical protein